ncbi:MAG: penicillin-binding protein 1C, partial [Bacteroidetes bacterium]
MHPVEFCRFVLQKIREHENLPTLPRLRFRRLGWVGKALCVLVPFWVFLVWDWYAPLQVSTRYSQVVLAQDSTILHAYLTPDQKWRLKTELNEISPALRKMLLHKEDKYFYYHTGINPIALVRAMLSNVWYWRRESGASTITMQVARMLEPKRRTYTSKFWEVMRALQLEWHYSKDEILQLYLNLVPYGGNIEGVKSASMLYFGKLPLQLSLAEVVTLTIIPNRPNSLTLGKHNDLIAKERNRWLTRLLKAGVFPETYLQNALREELNAVRLSPPELAPQFCHRVSKQYAQKSTLLTTLNAEKQAKAENLVQSYMQRLKHLGITNSAVLIINNETKGVEAYVGSANFEDSFNDGQVDGIQAVRSPGSTLKPFVYGLAIDRGIITPKTMMADVPSSFNGFEPENFFKRFLGNVTAEQALIQSLNIPAVELIEKVGVQTVIQRLEQANFKQIYKDRRKLGLSLILGGCGVTLEEMTMLFSAVATGGKFGKANFLVEGWKGGRVEGWKGGKVEGWKGKEENANLSTLQPLNPSTPYPSTP